MLMSTPSIIVSVLIASLNSVQSAPSPGPVPHAQIKTTVGPDIVSCHPPAEHEYKTLVNIAVDAAGLPATVTVDQSSGIPCLDEASAQAARSYTFKPAMKDGLYVASASKVEFTMAVKDHRPYVLAAPIEIIGGSVLPPVVTKSESPHFPHSFFHPNLPGDKAAVLVSLIVNTEGLPENIHVLLTKNERFNQSALDAVGKYRFKPATKDGVPVPVEINVEVTFEVSNHR